MGARIYKTTGIYPSLNKTGTAIYEFNHAPETIDDNLDKTLEFDEVPLDYLPEGWDSVYVTKVISLNGTFNPDESILAQKQNLQKLSAYYAVSQTFPTGGQFEYGSGEGEQIYCLAVDIPDNGTMTEELHFVVIQSMKFSLNGPNMTYSLSFREIMNVYVV